METFLKLVLFYLVGFGFLSWLGYGLARLLLPEAGRRLGLLALPLVGFCGLVVLSSYLNSTFLPMVQVTWILLLLATGLNGYLLWRSKAWGFPWVWREHGVVLGLGLVPYLLGALPLVHAGSTTFVGLQWDLEIYLPFTEYLKRYAVGASLDAPSNPLLEMLNSPPFRGGSGWGFSYFEATMGVLLNWGSHLTFRPALLFVLSLSVPAVYLFFRTGLRCSAAPSLVAAGLWSVNGLSLWLASIGLAGHTVALFALSFALTATIWMLEQPSWRAAVTAGLATAGLLLSFYTGGAPFYALPFLFLALYFLVRTPHRGRVAWGLVAMGAAVLGFGLVGHLRFLAVLPAYLQQGLSGGWHVEALSPLSEPLGLSPYEVVTRRADPAELLGVLGEAVPARLGAGLAWALLLVGGVAVWWGRVNRAVFLLLGLPYLALLLALRLYPYPYGYFKALSLLAILLILLSALGLTALWRMPRSWSLLGKGGAGLLGLLLVPLLLSNTFLSIRYFWHDDPWELPRDVWELAKMKDVLPTGATVYMMNRGGYDQRLAGMIAYFLLDNPIVGRLETAYGRIENLGMGAHYDYMLLLAGEDPLERGLTPQEEMWRNELVALYKLPRGRLSSLEVEGMGQRVSLQKGAPLTIELRPEGWTLRGDGREFSVAHQRPAASQQVELSLLNFAEESLVVEINGAREVTSLPAGLVRYRLPPMRVPAEVRLSPESEGPAPLLLAARAMEGSDATTIAAQVPNVFAVTSSSSLSPSAAQLDVAYVKTDQRQGEITMAIEVYERKSQGGDLRPVSSWQIGRLRGGEAGRRSFRLDLETWQCQEATEELAAASSSGVPLRIEDGAYEAQLAVYYVGQELFRLPWFALHVKGGAVAAVEYLPQQPYAIAHLPLPREVAALAQRLPVGSEVYVSPLSNPDDSFILFVASVLKGRKFFRRSADPSPPFLAATDGILPDYALLSEGEDPQIYGYRQEGKLWENGRAVLYQKTKDAPLALFHLSAQEAMAGLSERQNSLYLGISPEEVRLKVGPQLVRVSRFGEGVGEVQVELLLVNPSAREASLRLFENERRATLSPGILRYRSSSHAIPLTFALSVAGPEPLLVRQVRILAPGQPPLEFESLEQGVYLSAQARRSGEQAVLVVDLAAPPLKGAFLVLDVYSTSGCAPVHYGWWATPMDRVQPGAELALDLPRKQARLIDSEGREVPLDSQIWPTGDGDYRAFLVVKYEDRYEVTAAYDFSLRTGQISAFFSFSVDRVVPLGPRATVDGGREK